MPGLCGFAVVGVERSAERLEKLLGDLKHHPDHESLASFVDESVAAGLVLHQQGLAGLHWRGPKGLQVWMDGEVFDENGSMSAEKIAAALSLPVPPILNGAFSAVVYDPDAKQIRFITDPYGLKYLYVRTGTSPAWSGEARGFFHMPGPSPAFNPDCLREFLKFGYPLGGTTWFEGVELLEPGLVLTCDLQTGESSRHRYFKFEEPQTVFSPPSWNDAVTQLGSLFRKAVERRSRDPGTGLTLSGGLDSRAILAAMPASVQPLETVTFGKPGCADGALAKAACEVRGARNHFVTLGEDGWLEERVEKVDLTDGQINILHLHGFKSLPVIEAKMDFCLNGFLGDALVGGSYLKGSGFPFFQRYLHRGRRFILQALHFGGTRMIYRLPFLDRPLLQYALSLPREWLQDSRLYRAMLLKEFPEYYRAIAWEKTGLPISVSPLRENLTRQFNRVRNKLRRMLGLTPAGYTDYPRWLREGSAKEFLRSRLEADDSLLSRFVPGTEIQERLQRHFHGADESEILGRYLTAELWLQTLNQNGISLPRKHHES